MLDPNIAHGGSWFPQDECMHWRQQPLGIISEAGAGLSPNWSVEDKQRKTSCAMKLHLRQITVLIILRNLPYQSAARTDKLVPWKGLDQTRFKLSRSRSKNFWWSEYVADCCDLLLFTINYCTAGDPGRGVVVCSKRHQNFGSNSQLKAVKL